VGKVLPKPIAPLARRHFTRINVAADAAPQPVSRLEPNKKAPLIFGDDQRMF
jgi:hypothetical protein